MDEDLRRQPTPRLDMPVEKRQVAAALMPIRGQVWPSILARGIVRMVEAESGINDALGMRVDERKNISGTFAAAINFAFGDIAVGFADAVQPDAQVIAMRAYERVGPGLGRKGVVRTAVDR